MSLPKWKLLLICTLCLGMAQGKILDRLILLHFPIRLHGFSLPSFAWWRRRDFDYHTEQNRSRSSSCRHRGNDIIGHVHTRSRKRDTHLVRLSSVFQQQELEIDKYADEKVSRDTLINVSTNEGGESLVEKIMSNSIANTTTSENAASESESIPNKNNSASILHTFHYPPANITLHGLSVSIPQFKSWVEYKIQSLRLQKQFSQRIPKDINPTHYVSRKEIDTNDEEVRDGLRQHWFERRLISDRTEVLTVYPSNGVLAKLRKKNKKRGGFDDLLSVYTDRLLGLIRDEMQESASNFDVKAWLKSEYGEEETEKLCYQNFGRLNTTEQMNHMKHFLDWFRDSFPYYYDRCDACGASYRDDGDIEKPNDDSEESNQDDDSVLHGSFLGYCYPEEHELSGKASRTEIYQCHACGEYTRFPRFNSVQHIIEKGKGRCGEYSILLFRILRSFGIQSRWVVDWADHVWAEYLGADGTWVHVDPCEASINHPLLYEEWGKKQTFIVAFFAPLIGLNYEYMENDPNNIPPQNGLLVEDVTTKYTTASIEEIGQRREEHSDTTNKSMKKADNKLRKFLSDLK